MGGVDIPIQKSVVTRFPRGGLDTTTSATIGGEGGVHSCLALLAGERTGYVLFYARPAEEWQNKTKKGAPSLMCCSAN